MAHKQQYAWHLLCLVLMGQCASHAHAAHVSRTVLGEGGVPFDGFTDPYDTPREAGARAGRSLLTGISFGNALMSGQGVQGNSLSVQQPLWETQQPLNPQQVRGVDSFQAVNTAGNPYAVDPYPVYPPPPPPPAPRLQHTRLADHNRRLMQTAQAPSPAVFAGVHGARGQPSNTTIYTIINNNDAEFGSYVCIDSCAHALTCIWQNAWLWNCNGTNPSHHYWVWEPDTGIIRNAISPDDSFSNYPSICLDMCQDSRYGDGACAVTANDNVLNVGYKTCTGNANQQWTLQGTSIINKANGYCMSAGIQSCGRWGWCNKSQAQTRQDNMLINVFAEPCVAGNVNQEWSLGPAPNSTLPNFTPLNVSAALYPPPVDGIAATAFTNSQEVINFVEEANPNNCMSIENQASCSSYQAPNSDVVVNPGTTVCVWRNALLQTCWAGGTQASADQGWIYDNTTKTVALAADTSQNVCLEMCTDMNFGRGACSLTSSNVGWSTCNGSPAQQWEFLDGLLYNDLTDKCIVEAGLCMIDYPGVNTDPSAFGKLWDGYNLTNCIQNIKNGPWSGKPWNTTNNATLGIRNLVGGDCDWDGVDNSTLRFFTRTAGLSRTTDPIAPGVKTTQNSGASSSTNVGAVIGGAVGGTIGLVLILATILSFFVVRRRKARAAFRQKEIEEHTKYVMSKDGLYSIDSDNLVPAKGGFWASKLDLRDDIDPLDIQICKKPNGEDWKLGEGAFGTVYKANRFGTTPVAVKVLREESGKQIENFQREIDLLRELRDNNIVMFLGVCLKDKQLMLVTEFMPNGDLWNSIQNSTTTKFLWYQRGRKICLDVARGLVHLHSRQIVHMDLKSPNILLGKDLTAKIADVGLARSVNGSCISQMTSIGTMAWAAPELTRNFSINRGSNPPTRRMVTAKADVFSFGVVLWEVVTGENPMTSSRAVSVPMECPAEIEQLIEDCLCIDVDSRPTMKEVYDRLRKADQIPPPGYDKALPTPRPTPGSTPAGSRGSVRSAPRSGLLSGPKSGSAYLNGMGLAAAFKKKINGLGGGGPPLSSGGAPRSSGAPKSVLRADVIHEEETSAPDGSAPTLPEGEAPVPGKTPFEAEAEAPETGNNPFEAAESEAPVPGPNPFEAESGDGAPRPTP